MKTKLLAALCGLVTAVAVQAQQAVAQLDRSVLPIPQPVPPGRGKPGTFTLTVNGKEIGTAKAPRTPLGGWSLSDTFDVGVDLGSPVGDYPANWRFKGALEKVTFDLKWQRVLGPSFSWASRGRITKRP